MSDSLVEARDPVLAKHLDEELVWYEQEEWNDYVEQNGWDDRYLDSVVVSLRNAASQNALVDIAPLELREAWLSQRDVPSVQRDSLEYRIETPWLDGSPLASQVRALVPSAGFMVEVNALCAAAERRQLADSILYFAPLWIRSPLHFQGDSLKDLIDHLFVRYPVPDLLYQAWFTPAAAHEVNYKWIKWFICLCQGASLFSLGSISRDWSVHRRFQHHFGQISQAPNLIAATMSAELARLGVGEPVTDWIQNHPRYQRDITACWHDYDLLETAYWHDTVLWLQRNAAELNTDQVGVLLDWGADNFWLNPEFSWRGRTVAACLRRIQQNEHVSVSVPTSWRAHNMDWTDGEIWSIVELNTAAELQLEGEVLEHCVGGYGARCAMGSSAIFSLRNGDVRTATIEIDIRSKQIFQARGLRNRALTREEALVLESWLDDVR